jgi:hypothetical protein
VDASFVIGVVIIVVLFVGMLSLLLSWLFGTAMSSYESADREAVISCNPSVEKWLYVENGEKRRQEKYGEGSVSMHPFVVHVPIRMTRQLTETAFWKYAVRSSFVYLWQVRYPMLLLLLLLLLLSLLVSLVWFVGVGNDTFGANGWVCCCCCCD